MLTRITSFFQQHIRFDETETIEATRPNSVPLAACALLLEMAQADGEFSHEEMDEIVAAMEEEFSLSPEEVEELVKLAEDERRESIDLWQFSKLICDHCDREEKLRILRILWSVVYADGILDSHEDYLIHKLANVLNLSHRELIDTKIGVLNK